MDAAAAVAVIANVRMMNCACVFCTLLHEIFHNGRFV